MRIKGFVSGLIILCLVMGLSAQNTPVYAGTGNDEPAFDVEPVYDHDCELLTGVSEVECTSESYDMTIEEYLAMKEGKAGKSAALEISGDMPLKASSAKKNTASSDAEQIHFFELTLPAAAPESDIYDMGEVRRGEDDPLVSSEGNGSYWYSQLNSTEKKIYDAFCDMCEEFVRSEEYKSDLSNNFELRVTCPLTAGELAVKVDVKKLSQALYNEQFSFYWMDNAYGGTKLSDGYAFAVRFCKDYCSYSVRQATDQAIADLIDDWYVELYDVMERADAASASYLTALRLHDIIIRSVDYTYDSDGQPDDSRYAHSIAGIATGEGAVCEGYAKMFSYVLGILGVDNLYIVGDAGERHAWNAIYINGDERTKGYYLCDVTWDDPNGSVITQLSDTEYDYFCMPASMFGKKHTPDNMISWPKFADFPDYNFYHYFNSYASGTLTKESAAALRDAALGSQYEYSDTIHFIVADGTSYRNLLYALDYPDYINGAFTSQWGYLVLYETAVVSTPAEEVEITDSETPETPSIIYVNADGTPVSGAAISTEPGVASGSAIPAGAYRVYEPGIAVGGEHVFTAELPEESDDRVFWSISDKRIATVTISGRSVTVGGKRNGTVTLTARTFAGRAVDSVVIKIGTGAITADYYVWAGGAKDYKKKAITTSVSATTWTDAKGKTKQGKLVWLASDKPISVAFDRTKHTVTSKPAKTLISVDGKGNVTAKKPGLAYVYACDTGSCTYEEYAIGVLTAPDKVMFSSKEWSVEKNDVLKNISMDVDKSGTIYISSSSKFGATDLDCTYSVSVAKEEQKQYVQLSNVFTTEDGCPYFTITATNFDSEKQKVVTVKVNLVNNESGKKTSMNVKIGNPVNSVTAAWAAGAPAAGTPSLAAKNDTATLKLDLLTVRGAGVKTTDKLKIYVGKSSVTLKANGKGVETDKGATVAATIVKDSANGSSVNVLLKAKKDAGATAEIFAALTDAITKEIKLFRIGGVDAAGVVTLGERKEEAASDGPKITHFEE